MSPCRRPAEADPKAPVRPRSADAEGRAALRALLLEVEARRPGVLEQIVAGLQLERLRRKGGGSVSA